MLLYFSLNKKICLYLFFGCFSVSVFAQSTINTTANSQSLYMGNLLGTKKTDFDGSKIDGSPYFDKEFKIGSVITNQGIRVDNVPLRFDILHNDMQFIKSGTEMSLSNIKYAMYRATSDTASIQVFVTGFPNVEDHDQQSIYQLIGGGNKIYLLKYLSQKLQDKRTMGYFNQKELVRYDKYYLYTKDGGIQVLPLSEKKILSVLSHYKELITATVKQKNLNLRKEADVISLIRELDK